MSIGSLAIYPKQTIWMAVASYLSAMRIELVHLVRVLRRSPASAAAAMLTLALTLGAGASIYAVVDAVLLTPPPFQDPDALVTLGETPRDALPTEAPRAIGYTTLEAWRDRTRSLATIEAFDPTNLTLTGLGSPERMRATDVTPGFLALLGVSPMIGRSFGQDDVGRPVVIVSAAFWNGTLHRDPGVTGREIVLGGERHTIIGVLPERFFFPLDNSDIVRPLPMTAPQAARADLRVRAVARLARNVSPQSLATALDEISRRSTPSARAAVTRLTVALAGGSARTLGLLAGAAALAILIAFTNLAGLLIVRSIDRGRELAVRSALGARRIEIAQQLMFEAVAIVTAGTIAGVLLAVWLTPEVTRLLQQFGGVATRDVTVSWRVVGMVSLLAAVCACVCGLVPAIVASRRDVVNILRRGATAAPRERWLRRAFVTAVVSFAFVLLVSVSLVGRSLMTVLAIKPGFEATGVVTAAVAPPPARYRTVDQLVTFYSALERNVSERLGSRAVGIINELPLTNDRGRGLVSSGSTDHAREAAIRVVSTAYFDVMRIAVIAGRAFDRRDDASAPSRVVVSESLAARLFPGESPIGRLITVDARAQPAEIIGIVGDVKHRSLDEPELSTLYLSMWQFPSRGSQLVIRTTASDRDAIAVVREQVGRLDRDLPVYGVDVMSNFVARSPGVPARRVLTAAFLGFALVAVLLGAIGLFGVLAHEVTARQAELALRIALGANPTRILTSTLGHGVSIVTSALIIGSVLSFWASRALAGITNTSGRLDVANAGAAFVVLLLTGVCAVLPAARRAARTDPLTLLRGD